MRGETVQPETLRLETKAADLLVRSLRISRGGLRGGGLPDDRRRGPPIQLGQPSRGLDTPSLEPEDQIDHCTVSEDVQLLGRSVVDLQQRQEPLAFRHQKPYAAAATSPNPPRKGRGRLWHRPLGERRRRWELLVSLPGVFGLRRPKIPLSRLRYLVASARGRPFGIPRKGETRVGAPSLADAGMYVECTTAQPSLMARKRRKVQKARDLHDLPITLHERHD